MKRLTVLLFSLLTSFATWADPRIIAVTGNGSFEREADWLRVHFAVVSQDKADAAEARADVEAVSKRVVQALLKLGVSKDDIHSKDFRVDLREHYNRQDCPEKAKPVVSRDIEMLVRQIDRYQKVLDALVNNGVNRISQVSAELSNQKALEKQALLEAMKDAKEQAKFLVEGLGAELGQVHSIGDRQTHRRPYAEEVRVAGMRQSEAKEDPYDFKPQPVEVNASIYVEFEIE